MPSVSVNWSGTCSSVVDQDEMLGLLRQLAELCRTLLEIPTLRHPFLEMMTARRTEHLAPRAPVEWIDSHLAGKIFVNAGIFADQQKLGEECERLHLPAIDFSRADAHQSAFVLDLTEHSSRLVCLSRARIRGINFQIYDPRQLYPGEDRLSFLFLDCPDTHFVSGVICEAFHPAQCPGLIDFAALPRMDWYIRQPEIHLRYYLEEWIDRLLAWVKYYFVRDLDWWHWEHMTNSEQTARYFNTWHDLNQAKGLAKARAESFEEIPSIFMSEALTWRAQMAADAEAASN